MPATDTAPPPGTTPPSPAAAGKGGKGGSSKASEAAATDQASVAPPEASAEPAEPAGPVEDAATEPEPGWFRNTSVVPLLSMPDQYPSATLAPGESRWLPDDPRHPNLVRCDAPEPDAAAADTAGSEQ